MKFRIASVVLTVLAASATAYSYNPYILSWNTSLGDQQQKMLVAIDEVDGHIWVARSYRPFVPNEPGSDWEVSCYSPTGVPIFVHRFDFLGGESFNGNGEDVPTAIDAYGGRCYVAGTSEGDAVSPDEQSGVIRAVVVGFKNTGGIVTHSSGTPFVLKSWTGAPVEGTPNSLKIDRSDPAGSAYLLSSYRDAWSQGSDIALTRLQMSGSAAVSANWPNSGTLPQNTRVARSTWGGSDSGVELCVRQEQHSWGTISGVYVLGQSVSSQGSTCIIYGKWGSGAGQHFIHEVNPPAAEMGPMILARAIDTDRLKPVYDNPAAPTSYPANFYIGLEVREPAGAETDWLILKLRCANGALQAQYQYAGTASYPDVADDTIADLKIYESGQLSLVGVAGESYYQGAPRALAMFIQSSPSLPPTKYYHYLGVQTYPMEMGFSPTGIAVLAAKTTSDAVVWAINPYNVNDDSVSSSNSGLRGKASSIRTNQNWPEVVIGGYTTNNDFLSKWVIQP